LSHEDAAIHATRLRSDDSHARLYDRARKCGASHAQAVLYVDKCKCALKPAFDADWNPDERLAICHDVSARLERIERLIGHLIGLSP
jgi:hypothetical protein